jgi:hypothetical protein
VIDINKTYRTRDGREVRIYATDGWSASPIHGAIKVEGDWRFSCWSANGIHHQDRGYDLIEVRPRHKRTVWVNVYPEKTAGDHTTKELADFYATRNRIACIKVELDFEEGEGL